MSDIQILNMRLRTIDELIWRNEAIIITADNIGWFFDIAEEAEIKIKRLEKLRKDIVKQIRKCNANNRKRVR